jgi:hypothetical protein
MESTITYRRQCIWYASERLHWIFANITLLDANDGALAEGDLWLCLRYAVHIDDLLYLIVLDSNDDFKDNNAKDPTQLGTDDGNDPLKFVDLRPLPARDF